MQLEIRRLVYEMVGIVPPQQNYARYVNDLAGFLLPEMLELQVPGLYCLNP